MIPEGYKIVPIEPDEAMVDAFIRRVGEGNDEWIAQFARNTEARAFVKEELTALIAELAAPSVPLWRPVDEDAKTGEEVLIYSPHFTRPLSATWNASHCCFENNQGRYIRRLPLEDVLGYFVVPSFDGVRDDG